MKWKELMEQKGDTASWLRTLMTAVVIVSTGTAAFVSWQANSSFKELTRQVKEGNDQQSKFNVKMEAQIALHEQRLTSMEANRFTRIDGEQMQLRISDNIKNIAVVQTDLAYLKNTASSTSDKIDRILEKLGARP